MTNLLRSRGDSYPPAPGQVLEQLLDDIHLTQAQLARAIGVSRPRLNMTLKGRCPITPEIALRIERVFGISPQFWLRVRAEFELFEERRRIAQEIESLPRLLSCNRASAWLINDWQSGA